MQRYIDVYELHCLINSVQSNFKYNLSSKHCLCMETTFVSMLTQSTVRMKSRKHSICCSSCVIILCVYDSTNKKPPLPMTSNCFKSSSGCVVSCPQRQLWAFCFWCCLLWQVVLWEYPTSQSWRTAEQTENRRSLSYPRERDHSGGFHPLRQVSYLFNYFTLKGNFCWLLHPHLSFLIFLFPNVVLLDTTHSHSLKRGNSLVFCCYWFSLYLCHFLKIT